MTKSRRFVNLLQTYEIMSNSFEMFIPHFTYSHIKPNTFCISVYDLSELLSNNYLGSVKQRKVFFEIDKLVKKLVNI